MQKFHQIASYIDAGSHVLDVGCGGGQLASLLVAKGCAVDGVDIKLDRLGSSRNHYKELYEADIATFDFNREARQYDVVVFSDVLEHLEQPEFILQKAKSLLKVNGKVVISLPNVAYYSNRLNLLFGRWDYQDEGILDRTHVRFFTMFTAREFVQTSGYFVNTMDSEVPVILSRWKRTLFSFLCHRWPSLFAIGWVIEAVPTDKSLPAKVDA